MKLEWWIEEYNKEKYYFYAQDIGRKKDFCLKVWGHNHKTKAEAVAEAEQFFKDHENIKRRLIKFEIHRNYHYLPKQRM